MSRISENTNTDLVGILLQARRDLNEIKAKQYSGSDSLRTFRIFNPSLLVIDRDPSSPSNLMKDFNVTFTPEDTSVRNGLAFKMIAFQKFGPSGNITDVTTEFLRRPLTSDNIQRWHCTQLFKTQTTPATGYFFYLFTTTNGTLAIEYI